MNSARSILTYLLIIISCFGCSSIKDLNLRSAPESHSEISKNIVFYLAHQDDDVFISTKIQDHINANDIVYVVYTCLSYQKGIKYKEKRIKEARTALKQIGILNSKIYFLGYPDTESYKHIEKLIKKTDSIFQIIVPDVIYTSAYEGGNIDHDVANFVINYFRTEKNMSFDAYEFPEYSAYNTNLVFKLRSFPFQQQTYIRELKKEEYKKVLNHWKVYKSQRLSFGLYMMITTGKRYALGYEFYRPLPYHNYFELPPTEHIAYERYLNATYEEFIEEISKIIPAVNNAYKK